LIPDRGEGEERLMEWDGLSTGDRGEEEIY